MSLEKEGVVYNPLMFGANPAAGDGIFGGGGIMGLLLAGLLFGGRGRGGLFGGGGEGGDAMADAVAAKVVELQNTADLKAEVKSVEAGLRESILNQTIGLNGEFRGLEAGIAGAKLDAVKAGLEAQLRDLETRNHVTNKIGAVETEIQAVKCAIDSKIASSTQSILNHLAAAEESRLKDELALARSKNDKMEINAGFAAQFGTINNVLLQLANQQEKLTSQVVQFGAGNVATPTNTNNQVK